MFRSLVLRGVIYLITVFGLWTGFISGPIISLIVVIFLGVYYWSRLLTIRKRMSLPNAVFSLLLAFLFVNFLVFVAYIFSVFLLGCEYYLFDIVCMSDNGDYASDNDSSSSVDSEGNSSHHGGSPQGGPEHDGSEAVDVPDKGTIAECEHPFDKWHIFPDSSPEARATQGCDGGGIPGPDGNWIRHLAFNSEGDEPLVCGECGAVFCGDCLSPGISPANSPVADPVAEPVAEPEEGSAPVADSSNNDYPGKGKGKA